MKPQWSGPEGLPHPFFLSLSFSLSRSPSSPSSPHEVKVPCVQAAAIYSPRPTATPRAKGWKTDSAHFFLHPHPFPSAIAIQEVMSPGEWFQIDKGKRAACAGNLEPTVVEDLSHVTFSIQLGE